MATSKFIPVRLRKIAVSFLLILMQLPAFSQSTFLQHFNAKSGLPSNNCFYTLQDSKGFIWIATDAGVSRFDGKVFENFSINDGLPDNQILQLKEDKSGKIWFLALNGQLSYFYNGRIYNETNNQLLKVLKLNAVVVSFFQDSKQRIWLGTNKNLLVMWDGKKVTKYISANHNKQFINTFTHEDEEGKIWAVSNTSVRVLEGNTFKVVPHHTLPLSYKTSLNLPDRTMAYLDQKGLNIRRAGQESRLMKVENSLLNNEPGYFYAGNKDGLWLSNASGIYHIDQQNRTTRYLENISSSQVIKDVKGNMWFTTSNGIYMLPQKNERLYVINKSNGLSSDQVKSVAKDANGHLWMGLDEGRLNVINMDDMKVAEIKVGQEKTYNIIKQIAFDTANHLIYFASDYGLGRLSDHQPKKSKIEFLTEANNFLFVIKSFSLGPKENLALALSSGVVIIPDRLKHFRYTSKSLKRGEDYFDNRAYRVFYDQNKNLWFSNVNGLTMFSNGKLYNYFETQQLLTKRINDIQQLPDQTLVLATDGNGLIFIKNGKITKVITQKDGLTDNICKKLFIKGNYTWVVTNHGINRISFDGQQAIVKTFEYTNALLNDDVNSLFIDDREAYFATNNGLVYFSYDKPDNSAMAPQVLVTSVISNKRILGANPKTHVLDADSNNIVFYYSAIDFQNRNITYRYRLNEDIAWTETKSRRLEFSSLEPGKYRFEISAKSGSSKWSPPARVDFVMKAHFWQTNGFLFLLIIIAGFTLYKLAVVITKSQKNKEQEQLLLKNKILMLEQRALQAMMNPHFVFNVMNSIQHYINTKDTASANKILTGFAKLIRKNLEICTKSFIGLEEELDYLELYLSLEKKRFGDKLVYRIAVNKDIDKEETLIPSMILQPYIENAIWHGIMPKDEGGKIDILIDPEDGALLIKIIDNGVGIENSLRNKKGEHISKGMALTKERINLLNQVEANPIKITVQQLGASGTEVSILIPFYQ
ncbi:diguanylate cyclase/phosphodiesterase [Pedobacter sp. BAL39]|uniref:ligand-binding sensor domain-containing protein n=1 Tax=Pedobacter sp. BAL39 TaxID=391596 RepID=UPI0001559F24|nr:histidine kinase [Pedobacter sp. BAL39]EDM36580.1 diguanylate cyclase/phosphodiesterase [Pedobacter sp. BAL39]